MGLIVDAIIGSIGGIILLIIVWALLAASLAFGSTAANNLNHITGYNSDDDLMGADFWLTLQGWIGWIWIIISVIGAILGFIVAVAAVILTEGVGIEVAIPLLLLFYGLILIVSIIVFLATGIFAGLALIDIFQANISGNDQNVTKDTAISLGIIIFAIIMSIVFVVLVFYFRKEVQKLHKKVSTEKADAAVQKQVQKTTGQIKAAKQAFQSTKSSTGGTTSTGTGGGATTTV